MGVHQPITLIPSAIPVCNSISPLPPTRWHRLSRAIQVGSGHIMGICAYTTDTVAPFLLPLRHHPPYGFIPSSPPPLLHCISQYYGPLRWILGLALLSLPFGGRAGPSSLELVAIRKYMYSPSPSCFGLQVEFVPAVLCRNNLLYNKLSLWQRTLHRDH